MAIKDGRFAGSTIPVLNPDGSVALDHEEFPRPQTTAEGLAALKPSFAALADFDLGGGVSFRKQINRRYPRSEEHTSELQSLMRISYAVFCLKKKNTQDNPKLKHENTHSIQP